MPHVSVVVPNYNQARYLTRRLESVLGQSFRDLEVIFVDDASTDDSAAVAGRFIADSRLRLIRQPHNSGNPFVTWKRGLAECRGKLIWIAEADDAADPELLATLVPLLDRHPAVGVAYCQSWRIDEHEAVHGTVAADATLLHPTHWSHDFIESGRVECHRYLRRWNTLPNASAVVFRRALYDSVGGVDDSYVLNGDWVLWVRMLLRCDLAFAARPLNFFRTHPGTNRARQDRSQRRREELVRAMCDIARECSLSSDDHAESCHWIARATIECVVAQAARGELGAARRVIATARDFDHALACRLPLASLVVLRNWLRFQGARLAGAIPRP